MGCIASKPDETHQQKRLMSPETYTKLELSLRLLASRASDLRRRHQRRCSGDGTWLLGGSVDSDEVVSALFSPQVEMGPRSVDIPAQAVLMLVFPEVEGEKEKSGEMDTWQRKIAYLEGSILPVTGQLVRFTYSDILSATRNFNIGRELGRGALSRVYRGRIGTRRRSVAIKKIEARSQESINSFCRELSIAGSLYNPNIVPLIGFCVDKEGLFLVYKFVSGGTLDYHLHEKKGRWKVMKWEERYKVAIGLAKAVHFLHFGMNKCVIHRDIKPSNILLSSKKIPKLCDFGMATWTHEPSQPFLCKTVKGTFGYLAPEYFQHGKLSDKTDVYSFGVVLLELITGRKAIDRSRPTGDENLVLWAKPLLQQGERGVGKLIDPNLNFSCTNHYAKNFVELARMVRAASACLSTDESNRPGMNEIINILQDQNTCDRDWSILTHSGCLTGYGLHCQLEKSDMRSHMALAMHGVSDTDEDETYGR